MINTISVYLNILNLNIKIKESINDVAAVRDFLR